MGKAQQDAPPQQDIASNKGGGATNGLRNLRYHDACGPVAKALLGYKFHSLYRTVCMHAYQDKQNTVDLTDIGESTEMEANESQIGGLVSESIRWMCNSTMPALTIAPKVCTSSSGCAVCKAMLTILHDLMTPRVRCDKI